MIVDVNLITITFYNDVQSAYLVTEHQEGEKALHLNVDGCKVLIPWHFYKDGEIKLLN